jgi:hypothetical protein
MRAVGTVMSEYSAAIGGTAVAEGRLGAALPDFRDGRNEAAAWAIPGSA